MLGEGSTQGINESTGSAEKKFSDNFSKANTKFYLSLHYNGDESCLYENKTEIYKFKAKDNIGWYTFCLGSISKDFTKDEQSEISWKFYMVFQLTIVQLKKKIFLIFTNI